MRTRIRELSLANSGATFDELLLMSLNAVQASTPTRDLLMEENNRLKSKSMRPNEDSHPAKKKKTQDSEISGRSYAAWPQAQPKFGGKGRGSAIGDQAKPKYEPRKGADRIWGHFQKTGDLLTVGPTDVGSQDQRLYTNINVDSETPATMCTINHEEVQISNIGDVWDEQIKEFKPSRGRETYKGSLIQRHLESKGAVTHSQKYTRLVSTRPHSLKCPIVLTQLPVR